MSLSIGVRLCTGIGDRRRHGRGLLTVPRMLGRLISRRGRTQYSVRSGRRDAAFRANRWPSGEPSAGE